MNTVNSGHLRAKNNSVSTGTNGPRSAQAVSHATQPNHSAATQDTPVPPEPRLISSTEKAGVHDDHGVVPAPPCPRPTHGTPETTTQPNLPAPEPHEVLASPAPFGITSLSNNNINTTNQHLAKTLNYNYEGTNTNTPPPPNPAPLLPTQANLLHLLTWLSPAFPTGAFAYSHGLEWAIEARDITNETTLQAWLADLISHGTARSDTILLRHAHRSADHPATLADLAALATATAASKERRAESLNQGNAFLLAATPWGTLPLPPDTPYAIAVGATAGHHRIPEDDTAAATLQAFTANLISSAVRLIPLGQSAGLRVLAALEPVILATANETKPATLDDIGSICFRSDLAAMRHETQYTRLFRS